MGTDQKIFVVVFSAVLLFALIYLLSIQLPRWLKARKEHQDYEEYLHDLRMDISRGEEPRE